MIARIVLSLVLALSLLGCLASTSPTPSPMSSPLPTPTPSLSPSPSRTTAAIVPTTTPSPAYSVTPTADASASVQPSAEATSWTEIGDGTTRGFWSPDSKYLLTDEGRSGSLTLYTADGRRIGGYAGIDPTWLDDDRFVAYTGLTDNSSHSDVDAILVDASDGTSSDTTMPCCNAMGNGNGAAVDSWFPPHPGTSCEQPQYSVWSEGNSTEPKQGFPDEGSAWSPSGDDLVIEHPFGDCRGLAPEGWGEVVSWPGLDTILDGQHDKAVGGLQFSPTGAYLAWNFAADSAQADHANDIEIVTLASGAVTDIPASNRFSFAWNAQNQLLVSDIVDGTITTYATDGAVIDTQAADQPTVYGTVVFSSEDGSTVAFNRSDLVSCAPNHLTEVRGKITTVLPDLPGNTCNFLAWLSPNGQWLLATADQGAWLTQIP